MAIYQLFFIKNLRFLFIGAFIIILNIYDVNTSFNKTKNFPFPDTTGIMKIDVGQGEDLWILTENYELYHWDGIERKFIRKAKDYGPIYDFSVGPDGLAVIVSRSPTNNNVFIRSDIDSWEWIYGSDVRVPIISISNCDYNKIFTIEDRKLIVCNYDNAYSCDTLKYGIYDQISCAFHDKSLWFIGSGHYIYLYINKYIEIIRSEVPFKQIKALSKQHVIGIDYDSTLWEYINGTWTGISSNVVIIITYTPGEYLTEVPIIRFPVSCAFHDKSLWFIGYDYYIYLYINNYKKIIRSEVPFKQIKALSEQHAIGIDYDSILWKYINGTWTWIIRTASINYNGDIF
ncbi:hypothetical protein RhiirA4_418723 [Rhizophagus irregularis]|uniref:Uncharacterized protein n=1 Tax=Rhizophagus irregularis TaxID=588596 RepID=A0A2I1GBN0_9GLOM|nr:hypothetical protein RhiirA4_418723 [Rhizophagus irregularis]